jgi:hypothetical protein
MAKGDVADILMDENGDELVENGDFAVDDAVLDDVQVILNLNSGGLKSDPILGPNLFFLMNGKVSTTELKQRLALHLKRDNKFPKTIDVVDGNFDVKM